MKKSAQQILEFDFQVIPMQDAVALSAAGGGKYGAIATKLLEQMPKMLANGETFAFGLPGKGELPVHERRSLCVALSLSMKRANLNLRVTYSSTKKIFVVVPKREKAGKTVQEINGSKYVKPSRRVPPEARKELSSDILTWLVPLALTTFHSQAKTLKEASPNIRS